GLMRAGERAFLVTEELTIDGAFGNGPAVHRDVRPMLAGAEGMDDLRHHLLAAAALALDQHGEVGGGHLRGDLDRPVEQGRRTDDAESLFDGLHVHAVAPVSWMGSTTWPCRLPLVELVMRAWTMSPGRSSRAG